MNIKTAKFLTSVADGAKLPDFGLPEIAVAGKSNVGKSSFINFITNHGKLARTSGDPGRTRLLNYFEVNNGEFALVDLPGYGYAKVGRAEKKNWGELIEDYFTGSKNLKHAFVLVDVRHIPTDNDKLLLSYLYHYNIPFTIIATKSDKLSKMALKQAVQTIASGLALGVDNVLTVSSLKKTGREAIEDRITQILGVE